MARQAIRDATRDSLLLELAAGHERWAKQGAPRISYRVQELCFCPTIGDISASTTILAVGDSVHAVVNAIGEPTQSLYPNDGRPSIPFLFERAEAAIRGNADGIVVTFHPIFGFPTRVAVDRRVNVTDDELDIVVSHISLVP
ncbi:MAG: DUF6174 domain-containing protein [Gemmatimonadaceae bacterium]|nr:DUF6174 domain-containing protein [Gemmatimonadaceae bacterium]